MISWLYLLLASQLMASPDPTTRPFSLMDGHMKCCVLTLRFNRHRVRVDLDFLVGTLPAFQTGDESLMMSSTFRCEQSQVVRLSRLPQMFPRIIRSAMV